MYPPYILQTFPQLTVEQTQMLSLSWKWRTTPRQGQWKKQSWLESKKKRWKMCDLMKNLPAGGSEVVLFLVFGFPAGSWRRNQNILSLTVTDALNLFAGSQISFWSKENSKTHLRPKSKWKYPLLTGFFFNLYLSYSFYSNYCTHYLKKKYIKKKKSIILIIQKQLQQMNTHTHNYILHHSH